jgi:TolB protein
VEKEEMRKTLVLFFFGLVVSFGAVHAQVLPKLPGRIAYIGQDRNVYVLDMQSNQPSQLTQDGGRRRPYLWPTWSSDGRLAYFVAVDTGETITSQIYISSDARQPGSEAASLPGKYFTYAYWSPENCLADKSCRDLAVLMSDLVTNQFSLELVRDSKVNSQHRAVGTASPFYYSWSPDGSRMLWHQNNATLNLYDVSKAQADTPLSVKPGTFQAPAWSPVDDRLLFGTQSTDQRGTDLVILANQDTHILAPQLGAPLSFLWSPDGNHIAYTSADGPLVVVDSSGKPVVRSPGNGVLAFFWSPDSNHLAYVTLASAPGSLNVRTGGVLATYTQQDIGLAWSILDIQSGKVIYYGAFIPTSEMIYVLSYFNQFAQSHRVWSPDSRYLVYSELMPNGQPIISLLDTTQQDTVPLSIANGTIGVWSFN